MLLNAQKLYNKNARWIYGLWTQKRLDLNSPQAIDICQKCSLGSF